MRIAYCVLCNVQCTLLYGSVVQYNTRITYYVLCVIVMYVSWFMVRGSMIYVVLCSMCNVSCSMLFYVVLCHSMFYVLRCSMLFYVLCCSMFMVPCEVSCSLGQCVCVGRPSSASFLS